MAKVFPVPAEASRKSPPSTFKFRSNTSKENIHRLAKQQRPAGDHPLRISLFFPRKEPFQIGIRSQNRVFFFKEASLFCRSAPSFLKKASAKRGRKGLILR